MSPTSTGSRPSWRHPRPQAKKGEVIRLYELREYRRGRYARIDPEAGGNAGPADQVAGLPLFELVPTDQAVPSTARPKPKPGNGRPVASSPAAVASDNGQPRAEPWPAVVGCVAWRDKGDAGMVPAADAGRLALFDDLEDARRRAGALGVGAPSTWARVVEVCQRHGLELPGNGKGGGDNETV